MDGVDAPGSQMKSIREGVAQEGRLALAFGELDWFVEVPRDW